MVWYQRGISVSRMVGILVMGMLLFAFMNTNAQAQSDQPPLVRFVNLSVEDANIDTDDRVVFFLNGAPLLRSNGSPRTLMPVEATPYFAPTANTYAVSARDGGMSETLADFGELTLESNFVYTIAYREIAGETGDIILIDETEATEDIDAETQGIATLVLNTAFPTDFQVFVDDVITPVNEDGTATVTLEDGVHDITLSWEGEQIDTLLAEVTDAEADLIIAQFAEVFGIEIAEGQTSYFTNLQIDFDANQSLLVNYQVDIDLNELAQSVEQLGVTTFSNTLAGTGE